MYQNVSIFTTFCSYLNNFLRKIAIIQSTLKKAQVPFGTQALKQKVALGDC